MVNEFWVKLDRNGYAPSIMQFSHKCWRCGREDALQRHEPWNGLQNREKSKNFGMWLYLCYECHETVQHGAQDYAKALRKVAEANARAEYGWTKEEFIRRFGKSYSER